MLAFHTRSLVAFYVIERPTKGMADLWQRRHAFGQIWGRGDMPSGRSGAAETCLRADLAPQSPNL